MTISHKGKQITFEVDYRNLIENHGHERHYAATGVDEDGLSYIGTATVIDGELEEILNIENV